MRLKKQLTIDNANSVSMIAVGIESQFQEKFTYNHLEHLGFTREN